MAFTEEQAVARNAVTKAASIIEQYVSDGFTVQRKDGHEQVTDADIAVQQAIVDMIGSAFPSDGIQGEEEGLSSHGSERTWSIDPIDGTANFVHGNPFYCTSLSLNIGGEPMVGAVYAPEFDMLFEAVDGEGATLDGKAIGIEDCNDLREALVMYTPVGPVEGENAVADGRFLDQLLGTGCSFRKFGATALELCYVACGQGDAYVAPSTTPWDAEAGRLIASEAGAATRWQDGAVDGKKEVVAAVPGIMDELEGLVDSTYHR